MKKIFGLLALLPVSIYSFGQKVDDWKITATDFSDPYYGITIANGMIGLVSSPEPMKIKDVVLNGVYDAYERGRVANILKGFNFLDMDLEVDGTRINQSNISNYSQTLDMKTAVLITKFTVDKKLEITHETRALRHLPYTSMINVSLKALSNISVRSINYIKAPNHLSDVRNTYAAIERPHISIPIMSSLAKSPTGKVDVATSVSYIVQDNHFFANEVTHIDWDYNMHYMTFIKDLKAGENFEFAVVGSEISNTEVPDALNEAERLTLFAALEGSDRLLQKHNVQWEKLWKSDILVEGNTQDQQDIHSFLYHLYSFARANTAYSLSPMGLSGLGYNGHIFWDTEIWMFPPLVMLQPEIAKSLLEYRWEMLEMAKYNAFAHGYEGAMFPWESAATGQEETPIWALTGPFQHHITADVGWAFWKYYQVTQDKDWLITRGFPMLKEVANFWVSRVEKTAKGLEIKNVVGADEYAENINNDAYTNGMAKTVLRYATQAAKVLGKTPDPKWNKVADEIVIEKFKNGVTREHHAYNGEMIKQADVNLLAYPLDIITGDQVEKDLSYYLPKYDPIGPAMGFCTIATIQAQIGQVEKAYEQYKASYMKNKVPPFGVLSEAAGGTNPYFATGAGGVLQTVLSGFAGLEITDEGISQVNQPVLPKAWKKVTIKGVGKEKKEYIID